MLSDSSVGHVVVNSHRQPAAFAADCITCGWEDRRWARGKEGNAVQVAARRHAEKHPGHEVHLLSEATRVYRAEVVSDAP